MSTKLELAKLERVELRKAWETEAGDFTPWLAQEQNIDLLGETLGLDLEVEAQEKNVGPFRADILCKDTATNHYVLIENQLQKTDHSHLGQILTYAASLQARTLVWVAEHFTDEHRAALDWLNENTNEDFSFFGLEIELWKIGSSAVAPKFNIISKPNDWTKKPPPNPSTPTKQLQLEYWTAFRDYATQKKSHLKIQKPLPQHWTNVAIGRSNFTMVAWVNTRDDEIVVALVLGGLSAKSQFNQLADQQAEIEKEAGTALEWEELPHRKQSRVTLRKKADPTKRTQWPEQHHWLLDTLGLFHKVFAKRVKLLSDDAANGEVPA